METPQQNSDEADHPQETAAQATFAALGTIVTLQIQAEEQESASEILGQAVSIITKFEQRFARHKTGSDIWALNHSPGSWIKVDSSTDRLLSEAKKYAEQTAGVFDPTIGSLIEIWRQTISGKADLPTDSAIETALASCGMNGLEQGKTGYYRLKAGTLLDLGGIAKGYIAERVRDYCVKSGASSVMISLGSSSIAVSKANPAGKPWRVGLHHPDAPATRLFGSVQISDQILSTSGDDQKYFTIAGKRYHHILDPRTGYPAESDLRTVTVVTTDGIASEAYSTALLIMGLPAALEFCDEISGFSAIFYTNQHQVITTPDLANRFQSLS